MRRHGVFLRSKRSNLSPNARSMSANYFYPLKLLCLWYSSKICFFLYDADRSYVRIALGWILANAPIYMISKCSINVEILDTNNSKVFSKFRFVRLLFGDNRENPCLTREYDTIRSEEAARTWAEGDTVVIVGLIRVDAGQIRETFSKLYRISIQQLKQSDLHCPVIKIKLTFLTISKCWKPWKFNILLASEKHTKCDINARRTCVECLNWLAQQ